MTKILFIFLLVLAVPSLAQSDSTQIPGQIINTRSPRHVNLPGTRVFLVPPKGFQLKQGMPVYEKDGGKARLQAIDLVGGNYYTNAANFTRANFEGRGMQVFAFSEMKVGQFPAKMVICSNGQGINLCNIVFGDSTFSTSLIGLYPSNDEPSGDEIMEAVESLHYDKSFGVDPFAAAPFRLDDSRSVFKFAELAGSMYLYTKTGSKLKPDSGEPYMMVIISDLNGSLKEVADGMLDIVDGVSIKNASETVVNGLPVYKREVYGQISGRKSLLFQQVAKLGNGYVMIQGIAEGDFAKNLVEFEKLCSTLRRK